MFQGNATKKPVGSPSVVSTVTEQLVNTTVTREIVGTTVTRELVGTTTTTELVDTVVTRANVGAAVFTPTGKCKNVPGPQPQARQ